MKIDIDLNALGAAVITAPAEFKDAAVISRRTERKTSGSLKERLAAQAIKCLDDLEEMMEYEFDEKGRQLSKIPVNERRQINQFMLRLHPEVAAMQVAQAPQINVIVTMDSNRLKVAAQAAREVDSRMPTILTKALPEAKP